MANVTETPSYDAGIYQIETTDPVLGGPNGIANAQAKGLANRTAFLKQQIDQLNSGQLTPAWIASQDYVQEQLQKLDTKQSVRAATTANITLSGVQTIDGVALTVGDRVLVKDQTSAAQNGIYLVSAQVWTRTADADNGSKLSCGARIYVESGLVNSGKTWYLATSGQISIGSTTLVFADEHEQATETTNGITRYATQAEIDSMVQVSAAVRPSNLREIGVGQQWKDMLSSRALNTTYTNTTGKPIEISVSLNATGTGAALSINVNGVRISRGTFNYNGSAPTSNNAIIPNGSTYSVALDSGSGTLASWFELR